MKKIAILFLLGLGFISCDKKSGETDSQTLRGSVWYSDDYLADLGIIKLSFITGKQCEFIIAPYTGTGASETPVIKCNYIRQGSVVIFEPYEFIGIFPITFSGQMEGQIDGNKMALDNLIFEKQ